MVEADGRVGEGFGEDVGVAGFDAAAGDEDPAVGAFELDAVLPAFVFDFGFDLGGGFLGFLGVFGIGLGFGFGFGGVGLKAVGGAAVVDGDGGVGDAVGVGVFDVEVGGGGVAAGDDGAVGAAVDGERAGVFHAHAPEGDVVVVSAPVGDGAFGIVPPPAEAGVGAL